MLSRNPWLFKLQLLFHFRFDSVKCAIVRLSYLGQPVFQEIVFFLDQVYSCVTGHIASGVDVFNKTIEGLPQEHFMLASSWRSGLLFDLIIGRRLNFLGLLSTLPVIRLFLLL